MSLHPVKMNGMGMTGKSRRRGETNFSCYSGFVVKFVIVILAFTAVLVGHLYLCQQSVKSAERTDDIKKQIMDINAENLNLRNHVARLTGWGHVNRKIAEFRLPLRPAVSGQIIRIGVYTPERAANIPLTPLKVASAAESSVSNSLR